MLFVSRVSMLILFVLLHMSACRDETQNGTLSDAGVGMTDSQADSRACTLDEDCMVGQVCEGNECVLGCGSMNTCPDGFECIRDRFCSAVQPCEGDAQCESGNCDCTGICRPAPREPCSTDLQCAVQDFCDTCSGGCTPRSEQCESCRSDAECAANAKCRTPSGGPLISVGGLAPNGVCLRQCQGSCDVLGPGYVCTNDSDSGRYCAPESASCGSLLQCQLDAECAPDEYCNERGRCQVGCTADAECAMGTLCQGVRCLPPCDAVSNPCEGDLVCESDGRCKIENGCASSADCVVPETYCDRNTSLCVSGCEVDGDCQDATKQCVSGVCRERGCSANFQCAFGQVCAVETGQCIDAMGRHCEAGCDPMVEGSCGTSAICVSFQDPETEETIGDFCLEACLAEPNECPQGYRCEVLEDGPMGMSMMSNAYCFRDCTYSPQ